MRPTTEADDQGCCSTDGVDGDRARTIARLAYQKWQERGRPAGDDGRDWFEAEKEVLVAATAEPKAAPPSSRKRAVTP